MSIDTLTWTKGDVVTIAKLNVMTEAIRELVLDIPEVIIQDDRDPGASLIKNIGNSLKVVAGATLIPANDSTDTIRTQVEFPDGVFNPNNLPIVLASMATKNRVRSFCTVSGYGESELSPTSRGFSVWTAHQVLPDNDEGEPQQLRFSEQNIVFWIAIGY